MDALGEGNEENEEGNEFRVHEGIFLALYLTPTMYDNMSSIFESILNLLKTLIKTTPRTGLGFYIGNCKNDGDSKYKGDTPDGVYRVFKLKDLYGKMLKILDRYLKDSVPKHSVINISFSTGERWNELLQLKESDADEYFGTSLYSLLQQSQIDFNSAHSKAAEYTSKKVFLFTDCLKPWHGDKSVLKKLQNKLRDLNASGITVYPFILQNNIKVEKPTGVLFEDPLEEFKELFDFPLDIESKRYLPAVNQISFEALEEKLLKHSTVKRFSFQCSMDISDIKMSVKGINLLTPVEWKKIKFIYKDGKYHNAVRKTIPFAKGEPLKPEEITKVYQIADQYMPIDNQIQNDCMKFGEEEKPMLHIIGTRKFMAFNPAYTISKAIFMIADESGKMSESLNKFASLYQSLLTKKMMALCWGMPKKLSSPRMYYLIPTGLISEQNLSFRYPQSLAMIELPFGDELRKPPPHVKFLERLEEIDDTELLDDFIVATRSTHFENFSNPSIAWNFQTMEDHILQVEDVDESLNEEEVRREKQLKMDAMYQRMLVTRKKLETEPELRNLVNQLNTRYNRIANAAELKRISDAKEYRSKRTKPLESILSDASAALNYKEFGLTNVTNDVLKSYIKSKGGAIKAGKNKGEMIANIAGYLQQNKYL